MTDVPRFAYAYRELAIVAEDIRKNRAEGDPKLVEAGKLSADEAAIRLRVSTAIAVDWRHFARMEMPPLDGATDREKIESLQAALAGAIGRRDHMLRAIVAEYGAAIADLSLNELWAIHDGHDTRSQRVLPYLHWESVAAAIEAMLWWQQRPRCQGRRFITMVNIELRKLGYGEQERAVA